MSDAREKWLAERTKGIGGSDRNRRLRRGEHMSPRRKLFQRLHPKSKKEKRAEALVPVEGQPTTKVTFEEWCELVGTTTDEMAEAQERHEEEERGF